MRWNHSSLWLVQMQMRENIFFTVDESTHVQSWTWILIRLWLFPTVRKHLDLCMKIKDKKKNTMIFLEHRDILSAEQTWKRRHGMFQWKSFWHLVPLTHIICCHSNSWRLKWPDHNVRQGWRKKDLWLPKDTMARKSWLRVLLAIYHPWRGILKCLLCRGWGLGMSERVPRERRKIEDEVQLWQRCFPQVMPVTPPCSCLSFLTVRAWLQIKIEHYRQAGKKNKCLGRKSLVYGLLESTLPSSPPLWSFLFSWEGELRKQQPCICPKKRT